MSYDLKELRKTHVLNPETGLWDRVRRHQLQPQHSHYYDDRHHCWIDLKTLERRYPLRGDTLSRD